MSLPRARNNRKAHRTVETFATLHEEQRTCPELQGPGSRRAAGCQETQLQEENHGAGIYRFAAGASGRADRCPDSAAKRPTPGMQQTFLHRAAWEAGLQLQNVA